MVRALELDAGKIRRREEADKNLSAALFGSAGGGNRELVNFDKNRLLDIHRF
jgi:hypothetical protein